MRFFTDPTRRDRVRSIFLESLCKDFGAVALAKSIAALDDNQFDALCALATSGYSGTLSNNNVSLKL